MQYLFAKVLLLPIFATAKMLWLTFAQMAELVDALVSNTSEATRAGSIPALGTFKPLDYLIIKGFCFFISTNQGQNNYLPIRPAPHK